MYPGSPFLIQRVSAGTCWLEGIRSDLLEIFQPRRPAAFLHLSILPLKYMTLDAHSSSSVSVGSLCASTLGWRHDKKNVSSTLLLSGFNIVDD